MQFNQPSSTITVAFVAGQALTVFWLLIDNFTDINISAALVAESTILVAAWIGYRKKESVLPIAKG